MSAVEFMQQKQERGPAVSLRAPITDQSPPSRYERKDPQDSSREQIAKDRKDLSARDANEQSIPKGNELNSTGASEGAEGHASDSRAATTGVENHRTKPHANLGRLPIAGDDAEGDKTHEHCHIEHAIEQTKPLVTLRRIVKSGLG